MKNTIRPKPLTAASGTHLTLTLPAKVSTLAPNSGTGFPEIWSSPSGWTSTTSSSLRMLNHNNHFHVQGARPTAVFRVMDGSQSLHGVLQAGGCCAAKNEANATRQSNNAAQVLSIQRSVLPRIHARKAVRHAVREAFHNEEEESVAQRLLRLDVPWVRTPKNPFVPSNP